MIKQAVLMLAVLTAFTGCQQAITGTIGERSGRQWTFMVYMAAENDLEAAAISDFNELEGVNFSGSSVSVLVLLDRISGYDATNDNWTDTRLFEVVSDSNGVNSTIVSRRLDCSELGLSASSETELDMSDPLVLSRLITFGKRVYPAQNYGLLIWGHGTGWRGSGGQAEKTPEPLKAIAFDDTTGHYMALPSLGQAVAGKGLTLIGFDTCFAAVLEVVYQVRNDAVWFVGSEGVVPSSGWDYREVFTAFLQNADLSANAFCASVVNKFSSQYSGVAGAAVAQVKLNEIQNLFTTFEAFAGALAQGITDPSSKSTALSTIMNTVESHYFTTFPSDLYIDIYDFSPKMIALRNTLTADTTKQAAILNTGTALQNALQRAVPASWARNGTTRKLGVHVIPIQAATVPRSSHESEYIKGSAALGKSAFVEASNNWVPHAVPQANSFLDTLFY
jgi:hypothetical protein